MCKTLFRPPGNPPPSSSSLSTCFANAYPFLSFPPTEKNDRPYIGAIHRMYCRPINFWSMQKNPFDSKSTQWFLSRLNKRTFVSNSQNLSPDNGRDLRHSLVVVRRLFILVDTTLRYSECKPYCGGNGKPQLSKLSLCYTDPMSTSMSGGRGPHVILRQYLIKTVKRIQFPAIGYIFYPAATDF